ncbi:MAG: hypothetical protein Q8K65_08845 [Alphaproteobacteria bacterium]|nr:hypothetical protein [Alphaproteobacteria bacterium]
MSLNDETQDLSDALDDMKNRSRALNDSLRVLAEEGFDRLSRAAQQQTRQSAGTAQKNAGDIAMNELAKALKAEMGEALRQVFVPAHGARGGGINVVIHNNSSAQVSARETSDGYDQKTLEITIDQMVAQSLVRGRQTGSVLQSLFGLAPSLIGR